MISDVQVPFGLYDINAFYGSMDVGQKKYENHLDNMDCEEIIEILTVEGVEWEIFSGRNKSFD